MFYIDLISCFAVLKNGIEFAGGTNYALALLREILEFRNRDCLKITLILPKKITEEYLKIMDLNKFDVPVLYSDSLTEINFLKGSALFIPQVNGTILLSIPKLRKRNPDLIIKATLHDRQHNYYRFDWYDRYYFGGIRKSGFIDFIAFYLKKAVFNIYYSRCIKHVNEVITVSNYSMQKLMNRKIKNIKYYIQGNIIEKFNQTVNRGDYILIVGAGRPEKNLVRTMEAFAVFKEKTKSKTILVATGVPKELENRLVVNKKVSASIKNEDVKLLPYVSYQELAGLYANCRYVVFTSKGEGFGLPVREALGYGKTVLASRTTSIPEVAGSILHYVDPFNTESISAGFEFLNDEKRLNLYESYVKQRLTQMNEVSKLDNEILISDLLSDQTSCNSPDLSAL